ncbi:MAG TPA: hypothetical protein VMB52_05405 [Verrucomicrobiae bacterium]|nr:hypothetical protein [Verrucomicrobiae bacterium]
MSTQGFEASDGGLIGEPVARYDGTVFSMAWINGGIVAGVDDEAGGRFRNARYSTAELMTLGDGDIEAGITRVGAYLLHSADLFSPEQTGSGKPFLAELQAEQPESDQ